MDSGGFRKAISERNRMRELFAQEMAAQRASAERARRIKKAVFVSCLVGAGAVAVQKTGGLSVPHSPKILPSPEKARQVLTEIQAQLAEQKPQLIGAKPPARAQVNDYEHRLAGPVPPRSPIAAGEYAPPTPEQLELLKKLLVRRRSGAAPTKCSENYYPLSPAQAAGLPPQFHPVRRAPVREDYELVTLVPIYYARDEQEFPK